MTPLKLQVLDEALEDQIINEGLGLLSDPGVRIHNNQGLELLAQAGAIIDFEKRIARLPETLVRNALGNVPREFFLYDLEGEPKVHYGGDDVHFNPGSTAVAILDRESGSHRPPTTQDFIDFVRLVEYLPQFDAQSTAFIPQDVQSEIGDFYRLYLALNYMCKPIITGAFAKDTWWVMWEMLTCVCGGDEKLREKPIAVFDICPTPPLLWSDFACQNLMDNAQKSVPVEIVSMPLAGATAPVTLAGAIVQHAAETLSGITIHQLTNPGAPVIWGGAPASFEMREGTTPMGDVNTWLIDLGTIQIGKALGLPTHTYMGSSDAKNLNVQSGFESSGGTLLAALSGVNMVSGAGMLNFLRCQSFEKLIIDAEIISMAKRLISGIEKREDPIALDLMRAYGHQADFLSLQHTYTWFRKELYLPSEVVDHGSLDAWQQKGEWTTQELAADRIDKLLASDHTPALSEALKAELRNIASTAARKYGGGQLPNLPI